MQATSTLYKSILSGVHRKEVKAVIAGVEYAGDDELFSVQISNGLFTRPGIGGTASRSVELVFLPKGSIPRQSKIQFYVRVTDEERFSEWIPAGVFFFSIRHTDRVSGIMTVKGYDVMLRTEGSFLDGEFGGCSWPMSPADAAARIAARIGTTVDPRSQFHDEFQIPCPIQTDEKGNETGEFPTMREVLARIAIENAGNWTVTAAGKLRLVPFGNQTGGQTDSTDLEDRLQEFAPGLDYPAITGVRLAGGKPDPDDESKTVYVAATGRKYHYNSNCGKGGYSETTLGDALSRNLKPCQNCGKESYFAGSDSGFVIEADSPYATQDRADHILSLLGGYVYKPYEGTDAVLDPAAELGDRVTIDGFQSVLVSADVSLTASSTADIKAPTSEDDEDEYPYIPKADRALRRIEDRLDELEDAVEEARESGSDPRVDDLEDRVEDLEDTADDHEDRIDALEQGGASGGAWVCGHPKTDRLDFSGWEQGYFDETLSTKEQVHYTVEADEYGRPVAITQGDTGHVMHIDW